MYIPTLDDGVVWLTAAVLVTGLLARQFRTQLNDVFSYLIHYYLVWRFPIKAVQDGRSMSTCPYRWPNGQGNVGKFLEGEGNSEKWGTRYGRVYRLWSGFTGEVVIRDPMDVKTVLKDSDKHTKAVNNNSGWLMGELLGRCLGLISGTRYQKLRAATSSPWTQQRAPTYLGRISALTKEHFERLSAGERLRKGLINPVADLRSLPFYIVADVIYGELSPALKRELESLAELRESLWQKMIQGGSARHSWGQYLPTKTTKDLAEFKRRWMEFNEEAYKASLLANNNAAIRAMHGALDSGEIAREELYQTVDEMLFANLDVTIGGVSWNLLFLGANRDVQRDIRREIQEARKSGSESDWDRYLQRSDTLLAASIVESSRLKPLAAFSVPQSAPTDRIVSGYVVPAGTNFVVDTHALNIKNEYWGPDGETYRPSRFLEMKSTDMRYKFWRFGFGPRQCLGRFVVDLILRVLIAHLVGNYGLSLAEDTHWEKNPTSWIYHPDTQVCCEKLGTRE
ncbi:cytochrome P450 [Xylaria sp. CBS 124048]|nr:cytochrome P450 [Xylaria sp. CBS 124048]